MQNRIRSGLITPDVGNMVDTPRNNFREFPQPPKASRQKSYQRFFFSKQANFRFHYININTS
jgi:hypothetical protein